MILADTGYFVESSLVMVFMTAVRSKANKEQVLVTEWLHPTDSHFSYLANLPFHPFDRWLIALAIVEGIPVVSADTQFDAYPVLRLW